MAKHNMRLEREKAQFYCTRRAGGLFSAAQRDLLLAALGQALPGSPSNRQLTAPNIPRFCIDLMGKRPPLGGLKVCGFYIDWKPNFSSN
jgi:hypothetical protein